MLALLLSLLLALTASSCAGIDKFDISKQKSESVALVLDSDEADASFETVVLYFPGAAEGEKLFTEYRQVLVSNTESLVDTAMTELLNGPKDSEHGRVIPEGTTLLQTEQSSTLATVHLSSELTSLDDRSLLLAKIAIVNTLTSIPGVEYVTVMCEDKEISIAGYTSGPEGAYIGTLDEKWMEIESSLVAGVSEKKAVLYFQDGSGSYLIPEVRTLVVGENAAGAIFDELLSGPVNTVRCSAILSQYCELIEAPYTTTLEDGSTLLTLNFKSDDEFWRASSGGRMLRLGGIVLSMTSYMTDVDHISIQMDSTSVDQYVGGRGYLEAKTFRNLVGDSITLYFPDESDSALIEVQRSVDQSSVGRVREILRQLFKGPQNGENDMAAQLPITLYSSDILGIRIQSGLVILNFKSERLEHLFEMDSREQFITIYSIVNTVCMLESVTRVQFIADGKTIISGGSLSLENPLMPNAGLVY